MRSQPIALWIIGPAASGKSSLPRPGDFAVVDQDRELESLMVAQGLPLDTRTHDAGQAAAFASLRAMASDRAWERVHELRRLRQSIAFETTGDKPSLLKDEVELNNHVGYLNLGVGLHVELAECLERNRRRLRVLPDHVVNRSWHIFESYVAAGVYEAILGVNRFITSDKLTITDIATWIASVRQSTCL